MAANQTIRTRIFFGFGLVLLVIAAIGAVGVQRSWQIEKITVRVTELRTPTIRASTAMTNGINQALAALRGWMLLGDSASKASRVSAWQAIRLAEREMLTLSGGWTDPDNVSRLTEVQSQLTKFERFQNEIEEIAQKGENQPATKLLFDQAIPRATALSDRITQIIEIEKTQAPSDQRRNLLAAMADVRGTIGFTLADIRAYLLLATPQFRQDYERMWTENEARYRDLVSLSHLMTAEQHVHFKAFAKVRSEFAQLPPRMFALRAAPDHDIARFWLGTRAAPVGAQLTGVLDKMVASQYELLEADNRQIEDLIVQMNILLVLTSLAGLLVSGLVGYRLSRGISDPLDQAVVLAE